MCMAVRITNPIFTLIRNSIVSSLDWLYLSFLTGQLQTILLDRVFISFDGSVHVLLVSHFSDITERDAGH